MKIFVFFVIILFVFTLPALAANVVSSEGISDHKQDEQEASISAFMSALAELPHYREVMGTTTLDHDELVGSTGHVGLVVSTGKFILTSTTSYNDMVLIGNVDALIYKNSTVVAVDGRLVYPAQKSFDKRAALEDDFSFLKGPFPVYLGRVTVEGMEYDTKEGFAKCFLSYVKKYDGLIIEVQQPGYKPRLDFKIISSTGKELYGSNTVSQEIISRYGLASYSTTTTKARKLLKEKGCFAPLVLPASYENSTIILNATDASKITGDELNNEALKQGNVAVVVQ